MSMSAECGVQSAELSEAAFNVGLRLTRNPLRDSALSARLCVKSEIPTSKPQDLTPEETLWP